MEGQTAATLAKSDDIAEQVVDVDIAPEAIEEYSDKLRK
jgi:hypothetical protein